MPTISILMNCYNGERFIEQAIQSVLAQTWQDYQLVIWDNQSTDNSAGIVRQFEDPRIVYLYADSHTSLAEGRRRALPHLHGDWIAILDVDDLWRPQKLEKQMALAQRHPDAGFIYCRTNVLLESGDANQLDSHVFNSYVDGLPEGNIFPALLRGNFIAIASLLINKARLDAIGGFSGRYPIMEDYYVTLNLAHKHNVVAVQETLCDYRIHGDNDSLKGPVDHFEDLAIVRRLFPDTGAILAATRIIARHFKKCVLYRKLPRLGTLTRTLTGIPN